MEDWVRAIMLLANNHQENWVYDFYVSALLQIKIKFWKFAQITTGLYKKVNKKHKNNQ